MKILKLLFIFTLVSMIAVSCKETKKEEVEDDAVEMTEEATDADDMHVEEDATEEASSEESAAPAAAAAAGAGAGAAASSSANEDASSTEDEAEVVAASATSIEEFVVPEGVVAEELAETPVVYPGCSGSIEEIRACNRKSFIEFLRKEFNTDLAKSLGLKEGTNEIKSICQVDQKGKLTALKVQASHKILEEEMIRVIDMVPIVVPATKGGEAVPVSFLLPINFKVKS